RSGAGGGRRVVRRAGLPGLLDLRDDLGGDEPLDLLGREPADLAQHDVVVLAEQRARVVEAAGARGEPEAGALVGERPERRVVERHEMAPGRELRSPEAIA